MIEVGSRVRVIIQSTRPVERELYGLLGTIVHDYGNNYMYSVTLDEEWRGHTTYVFLSSQVEETEVREEIPLDNTEVNTVWY